MTAELAWPVLRNGSRGPDVTALQYLLRCAHDQWHTLSADGAFGPATEKAVRDFQASAHTSVDGIVGAMTWGGLTTRDTSAVRLGSRGDCVRAAQTELVKVRLLSNPEQVDGDFGRVTDAALQAFQRGQGLHPDGITGPTTWQYLICFTVA